MKKILALLEEQPWMIRDLVDGDRIDNQEEQRLLNVVSEATGEARNFVEVMKFLRRLKKWLEDHDSLASNSAAHAELDQLLEKMK